MKSDCDSNGGEYRKSRNLGRAHLIAQLRRGGLSRRYAKRILNFILEQRKDAVALNESVEFPFGLLKRKTGLNRPWKAPKRYTVEHYMGAEGAGRLDGPEKWSSKGAPVSVDEASSAPGPTASPEQASDPAYRSHR